MNVEIRVHDIDVQSLRTSKLIIVLDADKYNIRRESSLFFLAGMLYNTQLTWNDVGVE